MCVHLYFVCAYIICVYVCVHVCMYVCVPVCMYVCDCVCRFVCACTVQTKKEQVKAEDEGDADGSQGTRVRRTVRVSGRRDGSQEEHSWVVRVVISSRRLSMGTRVRRTVRVIRFSSGQ
jgi:hypothetical protein